MTYVYDSKGGKMNIPFIYSLNTTVSTRYKKRKPS